MKVCEAHGIKWVEVEEIFIYFNKCDFAEDGAAMLGFHNYLWPSGVIVNGGQFREAAELAGVEI